MSPGSDIRQRAKMLKEFGRKVMRHLRRHWKSFRTSTRPPGFFGGDISFTIVVPVFNTPAVFLSDCVRSVLSQTYRNWELVLVDDASTEPSALSALGDLSSRKKVRLFRHTSNRGLSAARNTGLLRATGDFVIFLDSDDFLYSNTLKNLANRLRAVPPNISGLVGTTSFTHEDRKFHPMEQPKVSSVDTQRQMIWRESQAENISAIHGVCVRRTDAIGVGGFHEGFKDGGEDYEFWDRFLRVGKTLVEVPVSFGEYRQKKSSMLRDGFSRHLSVATGLNRRSIRKFEGLHHRLLPFPIDSLGRQIADFSLLVRHVRWAGFAEASEMGDSFRSATSKYITPTVPLPTDRARLEEVYINGYKRVHSARKLSGIKFALVFSRAQRLASRYVQEIFESQDRKFNSEANPVTGRTKNFLLIGYNVIPATVKNRGVVYQLDTDSLTEDMGPAINRSRIRDVPTLSLNQVLLGFGNIGMAVVPEEVAKRNLNLLDRLRSSDISIHHG